MKKCVNCGNEIADNAQFCGKCGSAQDTSAQPTQVMPQTGIQPTAAIPVAAAQTTQAIPVANGTQAAPTISQEEYRSAKAVYKQARKDAGKTNKPIIILVIVGVIVVAAAAVAATLFFTGQNQPAPQAPVEESVSTEPEQTPVAPEPTGDDSSASDEGALSATTDSYDGPYASYVGMWKGQMVSTEASSYGNKRCYGAEGQNQEMVLNITSISSSGHMKAALELLYHGHSRIDKSDVDASDGDKRLSFPDLTGTFDTEGFEFNIPTGSGDDNRIEIEVEEDGTALIAIVTSYYEDDRIETDTYKLTKVS